MLWRSRLGNRDPKKQEKEKTKSESEADSGVRLSSSKSDCFIATRGVSGVQAADNGPTESILTFSLVIAQFAG